MRATSAISLYESPSISRSTNTSRNSTGSASTASLRKRPRRARFTLGYAGWAPGQLEAEMKAGYWVAVPSDDAILFDDAEETKWDRAMAKRRINL